MNLKKVGSLISLGHLINSAIIELGDTLRRAKGIKFRVYRGVPDSLEETANRLEAMPNKPYPTGFDTEYSKFLNELYRFLISIGHKEYAPAYQEVSSVTRTLRNVQDGVINKKRVTKAQDFLGDFADYLLQRSSAELTPAGACF